MTGDSYSYAHVNIYVPVQITLHMSMFHKLFMPTYVYTATEINKHMYVCIGILLHTRKYIELYKWNYACSALYVSVCICLYTYIPILVCIRRQSELFRDSYREWPTVN